MNPERPNIYEQQRRNRRWTWVIILFFVLFLGFVGYGVDVFYLGAGRLQFGSLILPLPLATGFAALLGGGMSWWSLQMGAQAVLASSGAVPVSEGAPQYRMLVNVVDEMSIASGLPRPKIYIVPDPDPNAFATGKDPQHSYIAVTEGLLRLLNREELQGVIAHEMSHVRNYDVRLMTVIAALLGTLLLVSDWARRAMRFGGASSSGSKKRSRGGGGAIMLVVLALWILTLILAPLVGRLLALAVSRQREYLADASAAELTRNPLGLASALEKLEAASAPTQNIKQSSAHLCIVDPLGRKTNLREGATAELFGTHPPISKRITLLKGMAYEYHTQPQP